MRVLAQRRLKVPLPRRNFPLAKKNSKLLNALRSELKTAADPERAPQMQAYMKSEMPFHGVPAPILKTVSKQVFADLALPDAATWERHIRDIWDNATFREERYAAIQLAGIARAKNFQTFSAMKLYEHLIVTGAWWDYVDNIASHQVGAVLANEPKSTKKLMLNWSKSPDMWKRRTAILCQLGFGKETDLEFLYQCIEPSIGSNEFFLRKGIGWALRQIAWQDPAEVIRYVKENKDRLSPLSKREALKNVIKSGKVKSIP